MISRSALPPIRVEHYLGTMLTADGHMFGWKDFGGSVLVWLLSIPIVKAYLEDTSSGVRKVP